MGRWYVDHLYQKYCLEWISQIYFIILLQYGTDKYRCAVTGVVVLLWCWLSVVGCLFRLLQRWLEVGVGTIVAVLWLIFSGSDRIWYSFLLQINGSCFEFNLVVRVGGFLGSYSGSNWNRLDSLVIGSGYRRRITLWMFGVWRSFLFFLYSRLGVGLTVSGGSNVLSLVFKRVSSGWSIRRCIWLSYGITVIGVILSGILSVLTIGYSFRLSRCFRSILRRFWSVFWTIDRTWLTGGVISGIGKVWFDWSGMFGRVGKVVEWCLLCCDRYCYYLGCGSGLLKSRFVWMLKLDLSSERGRNDSELGYL